MPQVSTHRSFPLPPLVAAGLMIGLAILGVVGVRLTGGPTVATEAAGATVVRELHFTDQPDGSILVTSLPGERTVDVLPPESNNFLRATLRGLAQARMRAAVGPEVPFRLSAWPDGRLVLEDPPTGRLVELEAFGPTNAQTFSRLLTTPPGPMPKMVGLP